MLTITPSQLGNTYAIYQLATLQGVTVFIWFERINRIFDIKHALANPAFDADATYTLTILDTAQGPIDAYNKFANILKQFNPLPPLNYTVQANRAGNYICEQTGEIFYKQADIIRRYNCSVSQLSNHIRRVPGYSHIKGLSFKRCDFYGNNRQVIKSPRIPTKGPRRRNSKPVQCLETGQIWCNAAEACEALGLNTGQMSLHLRNAPGYKRIKGMTFKRLDQPMQAWEAVQPVQYPATVPVL